MAPRETGQAPLASVAGGSADVADEELASDDLLVEEVSIDGMCGVY